MCGITGIIYRNKDKIIDPILLKEMTANLIHRGPDDEGYFIKHNIGFGFRRLSILDLQTGHQPLTNEDNSIWIVFNGEIYNFCELRGMLNTKGHFFKTKTDTEVIIHLYEEYKENCLQYLRGMFSFVIYDVKQNIIFLARDRLGKKPLYFFMDAEKFIFGSELKSIIHYKSIYKSINYESLDDYFTYGYIIGNKTIYNKFKKINAASYLKLDIIKWEKTEDNYWDLSYCPDFSKSESEWIEEINSVLTDSVKLRMISDVPLGAFLSGGIDSSSVVSIMAKHKAGKIKTFSIGFKESKYDERVYAREIAKKYNTDHYELILEPKSISLLQKLVSVFDEPFADSSAISTYYLSEFASKYVTVALSGDGGDELFAGYNLYSRLLKVKNLQKTFNKNLFTAGYKLLPNKYKDIKTLYYLTKSSKYLGVYSTIWTEKERINIYKSDFLKALNSFRAENNKINFLDNFNSGDFLADLQKLDVKIYLVDDILTKVDRSSMINSLEVRSPLLDHKFVELAFKIPSYFKIKNGIGKDIFKKAMKNNLTENILLHKKQGFSVPLNYWFNNELKDYVYDKLLNKNSLIYSFLDYSKIARALKLYQKNGINFGTNIWSLIFFDEWMENNRNHI